MKKIAKVMLCLFFIVLFAIEADAASESYSSTYSFTNSLNSRTHTASGTPTVTVTTSKMTGESNNKMWIEVKKKNILG